VEVIAAAETWLDGQPSELFLSGLQNLEFGPSSLCPSCLGQGLTSTSVLRAVSSVFSTIQSTLSYFKCNTLIPMYVKHDLDR